MVYLIIRLLFTNNISPSNYKRYRTQPMGGQIVEINQNQKVLKAPSIEIPKIELSLSNWKEVSPIKFRKEKGIQNLQIRYILFQLEKILLGNDQKS